MHDLMLAKQIIDELLRIISEKKLESIQSVSLEIGNIAHSDHIEDINLENLEFGLRSISKNTILKNAEFNIEKTEDSSWKITDIEV